jgi:hypothetical protein
MMKKNGNLPLGRFERDNTERQKGFVEAKSIEKALSRNEIKNLNNPEHYSSVEKNISRIDQVSDDIAENKWLNPEIWEKKNINDKRWDLEHTGEQLRKIFKHPNPPLFVQEKSKEGELGHYNPDEWKIRMFAGEKTKFKDKLFGDDPRVALHTYCHEFRHSYQEEQVLAYKKGFATEENKEVVGVWAKNWENYIDAPDDKLIEIDYEKYQKEYENYKNQPIEKDANEFADLITKRVFYRFSNPEEFAQYKENEKFARFKYKRKKNF